MDPALRHASQVIHTGFTLDYVLHTYFRLLVPRQVSDAVLLEQTLVVPPRQPPLKRGASVVVVLRACKSLQCLTGGEGHFCACAEGKCKCSKKCWRRQRGKKKKRGYRYLTFGIPRTTQGPCLPHPLFALCPCITPSPVTPPPHTGMHHALIIHLRRPHESVGSLHMHHTQDHTFTCAPLPPPTHMQPPHSPAPSAQIGGPSAVPSGQNPALVSGVGEVHEGGMMGFAPRPTDGNSPPPTLSCNSSFTPLSPSHSVHRDTVSSSSEDSTRLLDLGTLLLYAPPQSAPCSSAPCPVHTLPCIPCPAPPLCAIPPPLMEHLTLYLLTCSFPEGSALSVASVPPP